MKSVVSHGRKSVDCGDANIQGVSLVYSAMLPDRPSDFYLLLSRANRTEDRGVPKFELNLHCEMHSPAPSPVPTPVPTVPLRGMRDCVCMSERWIAKLNIHCPEVAKHFDSGFVRIPPPPPPPPSHLDIHVYCCLQLPSPLPTSFLVYLPL